MNTLPERPPVPGIPATVEQKHLAPPRHRLVETAAGVAQAVADLSSRTGPVGIDTERASGFRYDDRAMLIQLKAAGGPVWLVDAEALGQAGVLPIFLSIADREWILHAATQDLPCLLALGWRPEALFDTEFAARLLGLEKAGLGFLLERFLGVVLEKSHSAADWSRRPLPAPWLDYAAWDVELLHELREAMDHELRVQGKRAYAGQEFDFLCSFEPAARTGEPWRRVSGIGKLREPIEVSRVAALWTARDALARRRDLAPHRLLRDAQIIDLARQGPRTVAEVVRTARLHGAARREAPVWTAALRAARAADVPFRHEGGEEYPPVSFWASRNPVAARRLGAAREALGALSERHAIPAEILLQPHLVRLVCWEGCEPSGVAGRLRELGARPWQLELCADPVARALESAEEPPRP